MRQVVKQEMTKLSNDSIVSFFFENRLDTITTNPDKLTYITAPDGITFGSLGHDGRHFISIHWADNEYCFIINDFNVKHSIAHKRVQWINHFRERGVFTPFFEDGIKIKTESQKAIKRKNKRNK